MVSALKLDIQSVLAEFVLAKLQRRPSAAVTKYASLSLIADDIPQIASAIVQAYTVMASILETFIFIYSRGYRNSIMILLLAQHVLCKLFSLLYYIEDI